MPFGPWLLAHQGGWDEILFVLTPLVIFAALLAVARRRVDRLEDTDETGTGTTLGVPTRETDRPG